jgi:hypothetical protein
MARPKRYINYQAYRREYNARPDVKERNRLHNLKWKSKPEVRERLRIYYKNYMRKYWVDNPDKYSIQKKKIANLNRKRILRERLKRESQK